MAKGGKREGAGRKVGSKASHTLKAAEARKYLIKEVIKEIEPLVSALIKQGKAGNITALKEIFDRVLGKVTEGIKFDLSDRLRKLLLELQINKQPVIDDRERVN